MGNIDDKSLSALLGRIEGIKKELAALEDGFRALASAQAEGESHPVPAVEDIPIDISIPDVEMPVPPVVEPVDAVVEPLDAVVEPGQQEGEAPVIEGPLPDPSPSSDPGSESELAPAPEPELVPAPSPEPAPASAPAPAEESRKALLDTAKADTAVMDLMAEKQAWRIDRPGIPVKNIISAISLNDRVLLINVLFNEDPILFQDTIATFNAMGSLGEALDYIRGNYPDWDMDSEPVYRLMMAVRRKLA